MGMNEVVRSMVRAAEAEREQQEREKIAKIIDYSTVIFDKAAAYENVIVLGGYVAFFTVWSNSIQYLTRSATLLSGSLISASLLLYVSWHVLQMVWRMLHHPKYGKIIADNPEPKEFLERWLAAEQEQNRSGVLILTIWPWFFAPTLALGLAGGLTLAYNAFAALVGWPVLL